MTVLEISAIILMVSVTLALINRRFLKWPETIGVMALALLLSLFMIGLGSFLPEFVETTCRQVAAFDFSGFVLNFALGFLIFAGAFSTDTSILIKERVPIIIFATIGILISTFIVGVATWWMLKLTGFEELSLIHCFLFGALVSPTDPIAVLAILKRAGVADNRSADIAGESLLNDGIAVVVFLTFFHLADGSEGHFGFREIAGLLLREVFGGLLFGLLLGYIGRFAFRIARQAQLDIFITVALVLGGYVLAGALHLSAPLAMVVAGLWLGIEVNSRWVSTQESQAIRIFWESLDSIFNAVLFVLLGVVFVGLSHILDFRAVIAGIISIPIVLFARIISLGVTIPFTHLLRNHAAKTLALLSWGGLRGAISVALALSLTTELHRNLFVQMTYVVVVFSVLVQGLTVGALANKLGMSRQARI